jgi:hypothetical protein
VVGICHFRRARGPKLFEEKIPLGNIRIESTARYPADDVKDALALSRLVEVIERVRDAAAAGLALRAKAPWPTPAM